MARNKYGNKKVEFEGITFDSALELRYYKHLLELEKQGIVSRVVTQKTFVIFDGYEKNGKKVRPITYKADFLVYYTDGRCEVVDTKGVETTDFKLKKKLFEARYPAELKVINYSKIDGGWIELSELKKARATRKKKKS